MIAAIKRLWNRLWRKEPGWIMFVHPDRMHDLLTLKARNEWYFKYREYRRWRRALNREMSPQEVMAREWPSRKGEIGKVQGFSILGAA